MKLHRAIVSVILVFGVAGMLYACAAEGTSDMTELTTSAKIDLQRYMGAWYVMANIPSFADRGQVASRDVYQLDPTGNVDPT